MNYIKKLFLDSIKHYKTIFKVSVGNDTYNLTKHDKIQNTDSTFFE